MTEGPTSPGVRELIGFEPRFALDEIINGLLDTCERMARDIRS